MTRLPTLARTAPAAAPGLSATGASAWFIGTCMLVSAALSGAHASSCRVTRGSGAATTAMPLAAAD